MKSILIFITIISILFIPFLTLAQPLVPECGADCEFKHLVELAQNVMNFLVAISIPLAAVAFAWAGFLLITAGGSEEKIKKAHGIFMKVGIGFLLVLSAWLIVWLIVSNLLQDDYFLLKE